MLKQIIKSTLPRAILRRLASIKRVLPAPLLWRLSTGRRTSPVSSRFGSDRGTPVDRYYINRFLSEKAGSIRGRVLEVGDSHYTTHFGAERVTRSDVLHIDASNPRATLVGDLSDVNLLPKATFDCMIITQTLQYVFDLRTAVQELYNGLKPGGVLLLTVPGISQADEQWMKTWYWSFTALSIRRLLEEQFGVGNPEVRMHGNVFAAAAFLYGIAFEELDHADLDVTDPGYPVAITAFVIKNT